jgi:hypothetical protein
MAPISSLIPRSFQFYDAIDATPSDFNLDAGKYGITVRATVWGTATLQRLMPDGDGTLYVTVLTALAADGYTVIELPAGRYRMALAGVTALTGLIEQIAPGRMGG